MLDDHDRELVAARDGIVHAEHHDRLVDDHELQRQPVDEARLLAGLDELADAAVTAASSRAAIS